MRLHIVEVAIVHICALKRGSAKKDTSMFVCERCRLDWSIFVIAECMCLEGETKPC